MRLILPWLSDSLLLWEWTSGRILLIVAWSLLLRGSRSLSARLLQIHILHFRIITSLVFVDDFCLHFIFVVSIIVHLRL